MFIFYTESCNSCQCEESCQHYTLPHTHSDDSIALLHISLSSNMPKIVWIGHSYWRCKKKIVFFFSEKGVYCADWTLINANIQATPSGARSMSAVSSSQLSQTCESTLAATWENDLTCMLTWLMPCVSNKVLSSFSSVTLSSLNLCS